MNISSNPYIRRKASGTASFGLKKTLDISLGGWESRWIPLARVRWLLFENFTGYDEGMDSWDSIISSGAQPRVESVSIEEGAKVLSLSEERKEEQIKPVEQYLQQLEWTFGFESEFMVASREQAHPWFCSWFQNSFKILGAARTKTAHQPVRTGPAAVGGRFLEAADLTKTIPSSWTNFYFKIPL